ncbi:MAG: methyltransferase domain-containing protein [Chloroflexi bacterium]|nr:methyltransferase domain-containing protein [Chloroflexota bacterium]
MGTDIAQIVGFNQANRDKWVLSISRRLPPGTRVLDVGAGECRYRSLFAHCEYKTQDFSAYPGTKEGVLRDDWKYGQIDYVSDITSIPVPDNSFDCVLCTEVLEHVPEPILAVAEFNRLLKIGGYLFLSAPLGSGLHQQPYHYYGGFTPHFYHKFLPAFGFEIIGIKPNGGFFRHCLQEANRAADIIQSHRNYKRWHPTYWVLSLAFSRFIPKWFSRLDDEIFIEEFTVGYHVEARKTTEAKEKLCVTRA